MRVLLVLLGIFVFCVVLVVGFVGYRIYQGIQYARAHPGLLRDSGRTEFHLADNLILTDHGTNGFGNNPTAAEMAGHFSRALKVLREGFFTKSGKSSTLTQVEGQFITYCQLNPDSCVFLVHVPELRKFDEDAKSNLAEIAWMSAQTILRDSTNPPPKTVVVGVKGLMLYDTVMIGDFVDHDTPGHDGIKTRSSGFNGEQLLYTYFAPPTNSLTADTTNPTSTPEKPAPPTTTTGATADSTTAAAASDLTITSAHFGIGKNFADVTARVRELLKTHPDGFTVNVATLAANPLPGTKKHLNIRYKYGGTDHTLKIPTGKKVTRQALVDNAGK